VSVTLRDLAFSYGALPVLRGVTAEARPGRITALLGPNAAGKSTLLRCAIGALRPDGGAALVDGRDAASLRGAALARRVAYVAQRPVVSAAFTVRDVVALGRFALPADPGRVDAALGRLQLESVADRPFPALSVGQQQRVALARAVAQLEPGATLVLDEPASAMDLAHARDCFGLLRALADEGTTVLVALHDVGAAAAVADDAWILAPEGAPPSRLVAAGPVDEVMQVEVLERVFGVDFEWITRPGGGRELLALARPPR
jgi:iron complex transport system ATP-binding protein